VGGTPVDASELTGSAFMEWRAEKVSGSFLGPEHEASLNKAKSSQSRVERLGCVSIDPGLVSPFQSAGTERRVRNILRLRRRREALFGSALFGEPAWDMLLELYAAELTGRRVSVSGLCGVSGVPSTTALRWIKMLENADWITRKADPVDGRRSFLSLTAKARTAMEAFSVSRS
jgi:DNA-binding MarR family transcriptional regulator